MKRWSRASSLGATVLVAAVCATASPVAASTTTTSLAGAPRDELSIVAPAGAVVGSSTSSSPGVVVTSSQVTFTGGSTTVRLGGPEAAHLEVGTFSIGSDAGLVDASIVGSGTSCTSNASSRVTIHEVVYSGDEITALAATLQSRCGGAGQTVADVRFNSAVQSVRAGTLMLGVDAPVRRLTFTAPTETTVTGLAWAGDLSADVTNDTCSGATLAAGATCTVDVATRAIQGGAQYTALAIRDAAGARLDTVAVTALAAETSEGAYTPLATPRRVVDTRTNNTPLRGGVSRDVQVTGANGVPSVGVSAVVLNLTVIAPTANGNLTAYPAGQVAPATSSVNFNRGWTGANLVTVRPGAGTVNGKVRLLTSGGTTHVIVDVVGYYRSAAGYSTTPGAFGSFHPVEPYRLYDSRQDVKVNGYEIFDLWTDLGAANNPHVKALALNVTAVYPEGPGHLTVWNGLGSSSVPNTSTLNFTTGRTVPNMTIVPVSRCTTCNGSGTPVPAFSIANASSKRVHVIVDVVGLFDDNTIDYGSRLRGLANPKRILDTRSSLGFRTLGPQATGTGGTDAVRTAWSTSLSGNLTAAAPTAATALTVWSAALPQPGVSSMNPYAGQYVSAMVMPGVSEAGQYRVRNGGNGSTNVILDVVGTFEFYRSADVAPVVGAATGASGRTVGALRNAAAVSPDLTSIAPETSRQRSSSAKTGSR